MHNLLCVQGDETSVYISWQQQVSPEYDKLKKLLLWHSLLDISPSRVM